MLAAYATSGSPSHAALAAAVPGTDVTSVASAIRALVLVGHRTLMEERLREAYDRAVDAGDPAEAEDWYRAARPGIVEMWSRD